MRAAVVDALRPAGMWTDPDGVVHIRSTGTGLTFCGEEIGADADTTATSGCEGCVDESIRDYGRNHRCGPECHV